MLKSENFHFGKTKEIVRLGASWAKSFMTSMEKYDPGKNIVCSITPCIQAPKWYRQKIFLEQMYFGIL